jgi:hypothetical protein
MRDERPDPTGDALETATERTIQAENKFLEIDPREEAAISRAADVERRAEDVKVLAGEPIGPVED